MKRIALLLLIILTAKEWVLLGDQAMKLGYLSYARTCYVKAISMELIK